MQCKRGDIFYADLRPVVGSEQGGIRPVLIIQNNIGNKFSPTTICAAITSRQHKANIPTHVNLPAGEFTTCDSTILLEQLRTIDLSRLKERVSRLSPEKMQEVNKALKISLELL